MADDLLGGIRAAVGFLTTIPVKVRDGDYDGFAHRQYLFIPVAALIGLISGVIGMLLQAFLPAMLVAVLLVACIYLLTGINHIDGLSDTGDGIIASGTVEKKVKAMKDVHAGAGGLLFMAMDLLFLYSMLSLFSGFQLYIIFPLFIAEVCAKMAMMTVIAFGRSAHEGMGAFMMQRMQKWQYYASMIIAVTIILSMTMLAAYAGGGIQPLRIALACFAAMLSPFAVAFALIFIGNKNFSGVNGDVIGAANEIARVTALVVMGVVLWMQC